MSVPINNCGMDGVIDIYQWFGHLSFDFIEWYCHY